MFFLTLLVVLSTPWGIRLTGYEFFRKAHYILAMLYIGACWGHWEQLKVFLLPSLIVWFLDRAIRLARTALLHYNFLPSGQMGFRYAPGDITFFKDEVNGDVVRLDFEHPHDAWDVGQHFYLSFPESSIWQAHPFTPTSVPVFGAELQKHSYIFRAKKGETKRIAALSARRVISKTSEKTQGAPLPDAKLSVVLNGPYGERITRDLSSETNVLCIAGGTGITYVLPVLLELVARPQNPSRRAALIWVIRHKQDIEWVSPEIAALKRQSKILGVKIHIYVTRATEEQQVEASAHQKGEITETSKEITTASKSSASSSSSSNVLSLHGISKSDLNVDHFQNRPDLTAVVNDFVASNVSGRTEVFASGPGEMISSLRTIVAGANRGGEVWKGDDRWDVRLVCDDRLEW